MIQEYLKNNNYDLTSSKPDGIKIILNDEELLIKGSKLDLIELADYIVSIAISKEKPNHIHLDELSLINNKSQVKQLIIEKE